MKRNMKAIYTKTCLAVLATLLMGATNALAQDAIVYTTTESLLQTMTKVTKTTTSGSPSGTYIRMGNARYQSIDGFGYALTGAACYNLMRMSAADRRRFLVETFSPTSGYGANYVRISIGCSDFPSAYKWYTLCDTRGIENFALQTDETQYVIPVLKEVLAINPNMKIMAAPWTCPKWMKVSAKGGTSAYDSYVGGHLGTAYYSDYAQYFVKFVQAMKGYGLDIYAVTPQNEPQNGSNGGGALLMDADEEEAFIKVLAPAFHNAGITTKIYAFDHNFDNEWYARQVVNNLKNATFDGKDLLAGAAFHSYGGDPTAMGDFHSNTTDMEAIYTETSLGNWNDGRTMSGKFVGDFLWTGLRALQNWSRAFIAWNLMLDTNGEPTNLNATATTTP